MNGNVRAVETLKQQLECGEDVDSESDTTTVASLLKLYLRELPQALIVSEVQQALIQHYQGKSCQDCYILLFKTITSLTSQIPLHLQC